MGLKMIWKKLRQFFSRHLIFPAASFYWRHTHPEIINREGGTQFKIDPEVVPYYLANPRKFRRLLPVFDYYVHKNTRVLDVGASFGFYSIYCSKVREARVIAFEPTRQSYALLQDNIRLNSVKTIETYNYAVGRQREKAKLYYGKNCHGGNSLLGKGSNYEIVEVVPLDSVVEHADFVKIDVEGAEYEVLMGMSKLLSTSKPVLLFEVSRDAERIKSYLQSFGYEVVHTIGHNLVAVHEKDKDSVEGLKNICRP